MLGGQRIPLSKQETAIWPFATATASVGQMTLTLGTPPVMKSGSYTPIILANGSYTPIISKSGRAG